MASAERLRDALRQRAYAVFTDAAEALRLRVEDAAPVDTGNLRTGITIGPLSEDHHTLSATISAVAYSAEGYDYAKGQNEGTGIYGPRGQRIVPVQAKALVFYWKKVGKVVVFPSVAGSPATHFWDYSVTEEAWSDALASSL